jgi:hypothetical protein
LASNLKGAITLRGGLIVDAFLARKKKAENRTWRIAPGCYALHIGKGKIDKAVEANIRHNWPEAPRQSGLPKSAIVAVVRFGEPYAAVGHKDPANAGWDYGPWCSPVECVEPVEPPVLGVSGVLNVWKLSAPGRGVSEADCKRLRLLADAM